MISLNDSFLSNYLSIQVKHLSDPLSLYSSLTNQDASAPSFPYLLNNSTPNPLYTYTQKRQRDHGIHGARTAAAGCFLLDCVVSPRSSTRLLGWCTKQYQAAYSSLKWTEETTKECWLLAGGFHDRGYVCSTYMANLNDASRTDKDYEDLLHMYSILAKEYPFYLPVGWFEAIANGVKQNRRRAAVQIMRKLLLDSIKRLFPEVTDNRGSIAQLFTRVKSEHSLVFDHGLCQLALICESMKNNDIFPIKIRALTPTQAILREAARAAAYHNLVAPATFLPYPFVAVLRLADELQEWDRVCWVSSSVARSEIQQVMLGPFTGRDGSYEYPHTLVIKFIVADEDITSKTGFDLHKFHRSKKEALDLLEFPDIPDFNPKALEIGTRPTELRGAI